MYIIRNVQPEKSLSISEKLLTLPRPPIPPPPRVLRNLLTSQPQLSSVPSSASAACLRPGRPRRFEAAFGGTSPRTWARSSRRIRRASPRRRCPGPSAGRRARAVRSKPYARAAGCGGDASAEGRRGACRRCPRRGSIGTGPRRGVLRGYNVCIPRL
ncbi:uncharacterized protein LY79DRAFT_556796 [Colletotrichum navitas]|uniref:Uncharacterized protein n=1 Tax=Colletotrichum navitas TaxID=681940 RepID=A0AAD8V3V8_9PEZI|nr:uncharacterized protein LY79DRAFT_556796 [Colletotrichum navitas]KAK1589727.1 hypothetical protein LY79DRAFT_556796 [Colletotrichum navitas]